jgi:hypothetical protein
LPLFVDITAWADVINIDDVFVVVIPEDDTKIADPDSLIACPPSCHMEHAWVSVGICRQTLQRLLYPILVDSRQALEIAR